MNEKFEQLLYESGLTADGCWDQLDEYDRAAILKFGELIVLTASKPLDNVFVQGGGTHGERIRLMFGIRR